MGRRRGEEPDLEVIDLNDPVPSTGRVGGGEIEGNARVRRLSVRQRLAHFVRRNLAWIVLAVWVGFVVLISALLYQTEYRDPGVEESVTRDISRAECVNFHPTLGSFRYVPAITGTDFTSASICAVVVAAEPTLDPLIGWMAFAAGLTIVGVGLWQRGSWLGSVVRWPFRTAGRVIREVASVRHRRFGPLPFIAALAAVVLLAFGNFVYDRAEVWAGGSGQVAATLTGDPFSTGSGPNRSCCSAPIKYTVDGQEYQRSRIKVDGDKREGDETTVFYALDDPSQSAISDLSSDRWWGLALLALGAGAAVASIAMYFAGRRSRSREDEAKPLDRAVGDR